MRRLTSKGAAACVPSTRATAPVMSTTAVRAGGVIPIETADRPTLAEAGRPGSAERDRWLARVAAADAADCAAFTARYAAPVEQLSIAELREEIATLRARDKRVTGTSASDAVAGTGVERDAEGFALRVVVDDVPFLRIQ